ncbi:hypothetical protein [Caulobacter sp.]|uniref:hypothetical protein n=1 Tax=Caulobacter sp. TaxID=78 RepID=UPI003BB09D69
MAFENQGGVCPDASGRKSVRRRQVFMFQGVSLVSTRLGMERRLIFASSFDAGNRCNADTFVRATSDSAGVFGTEKSRPDRFLWFRAEAIFSSLFSRFA